MYMYVHKYLCMYACVLLVMAKYFENPWAKAKKSINKYSLNTMMTPKQSELCNACQLLNLTPGSTYLTYLLSSFLHKE